VKLCLAYVVPDLITGWVSRLPATVGIGTDFCCEAEIGAPFNERRNLI